MINTASTLLENPQVDQIMHLAGVLADPVIRKTMATLVIHGAMSVNDIPTADLGATRHEIISSLVCLEKEGLATSEKIKEGNMFHNQYSITEVGKMYVSRYMSHEMKQQIL